MSSQKFREQWIKQLYKSMFEGQEDKEEWEAAFKFYNKKN